MNYPFFHDFILSKEYITTLKPKELGKLRHNFYALQEDIINKALAAFDPFPAELKQFWQEIGFGYFHCNKERVNRLLDPYSLIMMNHLEDRYRYDIELKRALVDGHLVFFQTCLYQFLTIDRKNVNGQNAVYYKKQEIAGSLSELFSIYEHDREYLPFHIQCIDEDEKKRGIPQATLRNTFVYKQEENKTRKITSSQPKVKEEKPEVIIPSPQPQSQPSRKWSIFLDDDDSFVIG